MDTTGQQRYGQHQPTPGLASPLPPAMPAAPPSSMPGSMPAAMPPAEAPGAYTGPVPGARAEAPLPAAPVTGFDLHAAMTWLLQSGGSDLHITAGSPPMARVRGELTPLPDQPELGREAIKQAIYTLLTQKQREQFEEARELDFAYAVPTIGRFRANLFRQRDSVGAVFRIIPSEIRTLEELKLPPSVSKFSEFHGGMVLVTGPTGSGKSTTLAAIIDLANRTRQGHIMTIEDPIEFLHEHQRSIVNQREVGDDTHSFASALKHVLRQDPDIILVGEMRDLETISIAVTAAQTGHLVFATLHTSDAPQTIDRMIDVFPPHQQQQIRVELSAALQGVVCQTLVKTADGRGRVPVAEIMFATPAIRNLIREGKTHQIYSSMQAGRAQGMQTIDQGLAELSKGGVIEFDEALKHCSNVDDFKRLAGR